MITLRLRSTAKTYLSLLIALVFIAGCAVTEEAVEAKPEAPQEVSQEFAVTKIPNIPNGAEFYFSPDGKSMIGNAKLEGDDAHQVYTFNIDGTDVKKINGQGEDACSFYYPDGQKLIWTSTRDNLDMHPGGYSDANDYPQGAELYTSDLDGGNLVRMTNNKYYDAEVSISPNSEMILFGRQVDGKMDLWIMDIDGSNEHQITFTDGWQEGGAFFLNDTTIIYRAWDISDQGQRGMPMTIFTIKYDGTETTQITHDEGTNWAPFPAPDGDHFVFVRILPPFNFEIYLMSISTGEQTRLTYDDGFDGFPALSPDGKTLAFSSSRGAAPGARTLSPYMMDVSSLNLGPK